VACRVSPPEVVKLESALDKAKTLISKDVRSMLWRRPVGERLRFMPAAVCGFVFEQGLPSAILKVIRDLNIAAGEVSKAQLREMKKAVSVSFVRIRAKVQALVETHKKALDDLAEAGDESEPSEWDAESESSYVRLVFA
jgi:hypothetical protein